MSVAPVDVVVRQVSVDDILVEAGGTRVLAQSECPHRRGRLRFGTVDPRRMSITCPLHHSTFDLRTGRQLSGPPCGPLRVSVLAPGDAPPGARPGRATAVEAYGVAAIPDAERAARPGRW